MSKKMVIGLLLFFMYITIGSCTSNKPSLEEQEILGALTKLQESIDARGTYNKFGDLLLYAKIKIDAYQTGDKKKDCFFNAINKCYLSYEICHKAWKIKDKAKEKKRKEDMEKTMSFSQGFAAVSLAAAKECFDH